MKVIFKILTLVMLTIGMSSDLIGQNLTTADLAKTPEELIEENLSGNGNEAYLTQIGTNNFVDVNQDLQGTDATNLVKVLQVGRSNNAIVNQLGAYNQNIVLQNGRRNEYSLSLEGSENTFVIVQDGLDNVINQRLTNTRNTYIELIQQGNENEITHTQDGLTSQTIKVIQQGDGMKLNIIQTGGN